MHLEGDFEKKSLWLQGKWTWYIPRWVIPSDIMNDFENLNSWHDIEPATGSTYFCYQAYTRVLEQQRIDFSSWHAKLFWQYIKAKGTSKIATTEDYFYMKSLKKKVSIIISLCLLTRLKECSSNCQLGQEVHQTQNRVLLLRRYHDIESYVLFIDLY